ncbi:hypothetical protein Tsubulata_002717 [Turnera subulata]|uniref:Uncharacterized protein n=1 Tax=Turnera subulata TaxID=218843 RepID=A0A9Q0GCQ8_9ROSI|nr:hypothetical protein Tsubulata_002717 [Turnera subulata]
MKSAHRSFASLSLSISPLSLEVYAESDSATEKGGNKHQEGRKQKRKKPSLRSPEFPPFLNPL